MKKITITTTLMALFGCLTILATAFDPAAAGLIGANLFALATSRESGILSKVRGMFPNVPKSAITRSYIRLETVITDTDTRYAFNPNKQKVDFITERLLDRNDVFVPYSIGYFLAAVDTTKPSAVQLDTYPNNQVFATEAGATIADLELFWNGKIIIKTGLEEQRPLPTSDFKYIPQTQQSSATTFSGVMDANSGYVNLDPQPIFSGAADQRLELYVDTFAGIDVAADTAGFENRVVIILRGYNVFNGASYTDGNDIKAALKAGYLG